MSGVPDTGEAYCVECGIPWRECRHGRGSSPSNDRAWTQPTPQEPPRPRPQPKPTNTKIRMGNAIMLFSALPMLMGIFGASGFLPGAVLLGSVIDIIVGLVSFAGGAALRSAGENQLAGLPAKKTVKEAAKMIRLLNAIAEDWRKKGDHRYLFVAMHECIAKGILGNALSKQYAQGDAVLRLNNLFARKFLRAHHDWNSIWNRGRTPQLWKTAFEYANKIQNDTSWLALTDPQPAKFRVALIMARAHILNDIPEALKELNCVTRQDFSTVMSVINQCESDIVGFPAYTAMLLGTVTGNQDPIWTWRMAVYDHICKRPPDPSPAFPEIPWEQQIP